MKTKQVLGITLAMVLVFGACRKYPDEKQPESQFDALQVPMGFNWQTTKNVEIEVISERAQIIRVTSADGKVQYHKGYYNRLEDSYKINVHVPAWVEQIRVNGKLQEIYGGDLMLDLDEKLHTTPYKTGRLDGLLMHWKFDENNGSTTTDDIGGHTGQIYDAEWTAGISQSALHFDGQAGNVLVQDLESPGNSPDAFSIAFWFSREATNQQGTFIFHRNKYLIRINAQGRITFAVYNPAWSEVVTTWPDRIIDTDWHHVAAVYDGSALKLYIDGEIKATSSSSGNLNQGATDLFIGCQASLNFFHGKIDELMVFDKAISHEQILTAMHQTDDPGTGEEYIISHWKLNEGQGSIINDQYAGNHGTGTNIDWGQGPTGPAVIFNGQSSNIRIPHHSSLNPAAEITLMAWVKTNANETMKIAQKGDWDGHSIYQDKWNGWKAGIRFANNTGISLDWGNGIPQFGEWYHLCLTYDGLEIRLYVNGQLRNAKQAAGALHANSRPFSIGSDNGSQKFFDGMVSDVRLYGKALSTIEIQTAMQQAESIDDSDGDGIADTDDDYPNDPSRAFDNFFPAEGFASLAFEDLWPNKGDYDFNDLVADYRFKLVTNASNYLTEVVASFVIRANGAGLQNGFGFQLPGNILSEDVVVTGYRLTESYIGLLVNGIEADQEMMTIIVFDNIREVLQSPEGFGANVIPDQPFIEPVDFEVVIEIAPNKYKLTDLNIEDFNPFLIVNKVRGHEIHLPGYRPTSLADMSLFGMADDDSDFATERFYKTANNLPWAINIASPFDYTIEGSQITNGYLRFTEWAESGGDNYKDWYLDKAGYRNNTHIYTAP